MQDSPVAAFCHVSAAVGDLVPPVPGDSGDISSNSPGSPSATSADSPSTPAGRPDRKRSSVDDNRGDVDSDIRDDCKPVVVDDKARAERLADSTGNGDPSLGGSGEEWEGFILSGSAIQASRLCGAVSFETHEIFQLGIGICV